MIPNWDGSPIGQVSKPTWELWLTNTGKTAVKAKVFEAEEGWAQSEAMKLSEELRAATVLLVRCGSSVVIGGWNKGEAMKGEWDK